VLDQERRGGEPQTACLQKRRGGSVKSLLKKNKLTLYTESAIVHIPAVNNDTHQNKGLNIRFLKI